MNGKLTGKIAVVTAQRRRRADALTATFSESLESLGSKGQRT
jgi:hypothetical protein